MTRHEECYFYWEDHDMGATIPNCTYANHDYGVCPCEGCTHILTKSKAREILTQYITDHPDVLESDREAQSRTPDAIKQVAQRIAALDFESFKEAIEKSIVGGGRNNRA